MSSQQITELRHISQDALKGLTHLESLFHAIKLASRDALNRTDPAENLEHIDSLSGLGAGYASFHLGKMSGSDSIIENLDQPKIDMMKSALQADCIVKSLSALCQVIPDDQTDTIGAIKTVLKLAHDLSTHLASGGRFKYVLKEALVQAESQDE